MPLLLTAGQKEVDTADSIDSVRAACAARSSMLMASTRSCMWLLRVRAGLSVEVSVDCLQENISMPSWLEHEDHERVVRPACGTV